MLNIGYRLFYAVTHDRAYGDVILNFYIQHADRYLYLVIVLCLQFSANAYCTMFGHIIRHDW